MPDLIRICGVPDHLGADTLCRWANPRVTWCIQDLLPGLDYETMRDAFALAWSYWAEVCGIEPVYSVNARTSQVLVGVGRIDGPQGVLAQSELPCGSPVQLGQEYDASELWVIAEDPPADRIDLVRVAAHEIGHVIGLPHIAQGNLLAPYYSRTIRRPQAGDIREAVQRYGPRRAATPAPAPPPAPTPSPPPRPAPAPAPSPAPTPAPPTPPTGGNAMDLWTYLLAGLKIARQGAALTRTTADDQILDGLIELVEQYLAGNLTEAKVLSALTSAMP